MATTPRYTQFSERWEDARPQLAENVRDTHQALEERVTGRLVTIRRYPASGATTNKIPLGAMSPAPAAVLLVRAYASDNAGADLGATARLNFYLDASGVGVFEPSGLTASVLYDLTFLVLES